MWTKGVTKREEKRMEGRKDRKRGDLNRTSHHKEKTNTGMKRRKK